jgi:hypothetical protein
MPQKNKNKKKENKKVVKKVIKTVIKNGKNQPLLKNSINIKIDLDDDNEKKKKPKRKKRQQKQADETANNEAASYVDEVGRPISNEIINKSFSGSYMPQPFSRNSSVIGTSFNESAIMDRVTEKMSRLNTSNQSMNQSMNQSGMAPPQLPQRQPQQVLSTIASASPSVAQSLNFDLTSPVRPVGITALTSSSLPINAVQQFALSSLSAAKISQEAYDKIFGDMDISYIKEIEKFTNMVKQQKLGKINEAVTNAGKSSSFKSFFRTFYNEGKGQLDADTAAYYAWKLFKLLL